jgi:Tol biopolymer transport system component/serine/threonine protein kinase
MSSPAIRDREQWERATALFDDFVELPADERRRSLRAVEARDPELAQAVARLLAADAVDTDLLDRPLALSAAGEGASELAEPMPARAGVYRITGRLGRGGMAEVFAGERDDGAFEQRVAVKVLRRGLDTEDLLARFARERRILARLEHPAIARLLDAGRLADGRPYLVMERVDGRPIDRFAEELALPLEERLRLLIVACDAVAYAHRNLVVHRDLKPSNVLISATGDVKLLDFGIAKLLAPEPGGAAASTVRELRALTPAYAAPEQLAGAPTTTATDVWGLGALAFELLVHEPPYGPPAAGGGAAFVAPTEPPPRASTRLLERFGWSAEGRRAAAPLSGDLDLVIGMALSLDPERRYGSAEAFADDLRRHLAGRPVRARSASLGYRLQKFVGRHRGGVAATAVVVASLAVGGGIAIWQARAAARERARPLPAVRFLTFSGHDGAPSVSPDGREIAFSSTRDGRSRIWTHRLDNGDERPLTGGDDRSPRYSPDGSEILFTRFRTGSGALYTVPRNGGGERLRFDDALFGDYSPDGARVALLRQREGARGVETTLAVGGREGGDTRDLATFAGRALHPPRWSPDGRTIALTASAIPVGERASIAFVDAASGRIRRAAWPGSLPRGLAWSAPNRLAFAQPDSVVGWVTGGSSRLVLRDPRDPEAGAGRTVLASPSSISSFDIAGAGRIVFTSVSFRVNLREVGLAADGSEASRRWLTRGESSDRQPSFSPDGRTIVFSSNRGGNLDLWVTDLATGAERRLTHDPALDWDPAFTTDGHLLWSTNRGGSFEIWRADADGSHAVQLSHDGNAENPTATPDGRWIVYVSLNADQPGIEKMRPDGSDVRRIVGGELVLPEVSPDGQLVAFLDYGGRRPALRVATVADGRLLDFELPLPLSDPGADPDLGRARWFPDGRSLAVLMRDGDGAFVVERHFLRPRAADPEIPPVELAREPGYAAESFGISPDGRTLMVAFWDTTSNLMLAENVPEIER